MGYISLVTPHMHELLLFHQIQIKAWELLS